MTLSEVNVNRLRAIAEDTERPVSRVLDDFLTSRFLDEDRLIGRLTDETTIRISKATSALVAAEAGELVAPDAVMALAITLLERGRRMQGD